MPPRGAYPPDHLPGAVVWSVALLALVFLGGGLYLYSTGVFRPPLDIQVMDFPAATVLGTTYQGTVLGLNSAWKNLETELSLGKVAHGPALIIYPGSPLTLRPIAVAGFVGFLTEFPVTSTLPPGIRRLDLPARRMLRVRIPGQGVLTGMRAFRFAQKLQGRGGYRLAEGERYEMRVLYHGRPCLEHWLPITIPASSPEEPAPRLDESPRPWGR